MEFLLCNAGAARRATMGGREYLVAPLTLIVPGVLNGSQGRLYYPPEEVARRPGVWNGMPLVVRHPILNGVHVSARSPGVMDTSGIGTVFNDTVVDGERRAEGWFEVAAVERVDRTLPSGIRIMPRLLKGDRIELSTGLGVDRDPATGVYNGETYEAVARNYEPDHVAILPDETGACSNDDGCGVNVGNVGAANCGGEGSGVPGPCPAGGGGGESGGDGGEKTQFRNQRREPMNRDQMIQYLTTNCECWKGEKDREVLNTFADEKLAKLVKGTKQIIIVNALKGGKIRNADGDEMEAAGVDIAALAEFLGIQTDPASDPVGFVKELQGRLGEVLAKLGPAAEPVVSQEAEEEEEEMMEEEELTTLAEPVANKKKPRTAEQWLATAPAAVQSAVRNAIRVEHDEKVKCVRQLTANVEDNARRKAIGAKLMKKSLEELTDLVSLIPTANHEDHSYIGATGGGFGLTENESMEVLDLESARATYSKKAAV